MRSFRSFGLVLLCTLWTASVPTAAGQASIARQDGPPGPADMIARSDDAGTSRGVNVPLERLDADGWFFPASDALHRHPPIRRTSSASCARRPRVHAEALTSSRFRDAVGAGNVALVAYRQLIEKPGLKSMRRPEDRG